MIHGGWKAPFKGLGTGFLAAAIAPRQSLIDIPIDNSPGCQRRISADWGLLSSPCRLSLCGSPPGKVAGLVQSVDSFNSLVLAGGRGGGKSILLVCLIGYFALTSGDGFNAVLIRHDLAGLSKLEDLLQGQLPMLLPGSRYLKAKRTWRLSNGGILRLIHMDGGEAFATGALSHDRGEAALGQIKHRQAGL
jgi:hypothetical protein